MEQTKKKLTALNVTLALTIIACLLAFVYIVSSVYNLKNDIESASSCDREIYKEAATAMQKSALEACPRDTNEFNATKKNIFLCSKIIETNNLIESAIVDQNGTLMGCRNCDIDSLKDIEAYFAEGESQKIYYDSKNPSNYLTIYYGESTLERDFYLLIVLLLLSVTLFGAVTYMAAVRSRTHETASIWKGLNRETAHQLGTPLMALTGMQDMLSLDAKSVEEAAAELGKDIERLQQVSNRLEQMGIGSPTMTEGLLSQDIAKVVDYMSSRFSNFAVISLEERTKDIRLRYNPDLIRWAVENISKNAADAIGGSLSAKMSSGGTCDKGKIAISISADDRNAYIEIADNGPGMTPETRKMLFRAGYSTKKEGWGIGLALVERIVNDYHNGKVEVLDTKLGVGTTFRITLPKRSVEA